MEQVSCDLLLATLKDLGHIKKLHQPWLSIVVNDQQTLYHVGSHAPDGTAVTAASPVSHRMGCIDMECDVSSLGTLQTGLAIRVITQTPWLARRPTLINMNAQHDQVHLYSHSITKDDTSCQIISSIKRYWLDRSSRHLRLSELHS